METKHKEFKPFDKVLVKLGVNYKWGLSLYSHFDEEIRRHVCIGLDERLDSDILPYEGNEHLVGTTDEPEEEVKLEDGEWGFATCEKKDSLKPNKMVLIQFLDVSCGEIQSVEGYYYKYFIRFSNFNPYDMEETAKHILCVKNGKVVKYKG